MQNIPETPNMPVLRTDFSNDMAWHAIGDAIAQPYRDAGLEVMLGFINDPAYDGLTPEQVLALIPEDYPHSCIFIVDSIAMTDAEHQLLAMKLTQDIFSDADAEIYLPRGSTLRIYPEVVSDIEINLSLSNMDFEEFADFEDF
jgi:hypothetical protein